MARKRIRDLDAQASITSTLKLAVDDTSLPEAKRVSISQLDDRYGAIGAPCFIEWFQITGEATNISQQNVFQKFTISSAAAGVTSANGLAVNSQGRVTYTGATATFRVQVFASISGQNNDDIHIAIALNNSVLAKTEQSLILGSGAKDGGIGTQCLVSVASSGFLDIFVKNATATSAVTLEKIIVIVEKIG